MSLGGRLYRGEVGFDFIGKRRRWYFASLVILAVCVLSFVIRGFNFGIEFRGGNSFQFPATNVQSLEQIDSAVAPTNVEVVSRQFVGSGGTRNVLVKTPEINPQQEQAIRNALSRSFGIRATDVSVSSVSSSWGGEVTTRALRALVIFLVLVVIFIAIRFEVKMSAAAILALFHDLVMSAGIYSLVGFEVTPSTIVGLLTILGYSLYDTIVVFDKVSENTRGILGGTRQTYSEAANLAVNQTLMRSINTSLFALLPVAGLLFVGAGLLGVGTLKDLALVLFVGLASGAYSSIFIATPLLCDLKEREQPYVALRKRVLSKRAQVAKTAKQPAAKGAAVDADDETAEPVDTEAEPVAAVASTPPRPGARPQQRRPQQRKKGGRPSAKRRR